MTDTEIPKPANDQGGLVEAMTLPRNQRELSGWAWLAIVSLGLAGALALLVAFSRAPGLYQYAPGIVDGFKKWLITHVDLSVVVWNFSVFGGLLLLGAISMPKGAEKLKRLSRAGQWLAWFGTLLILVATFLPGGEPTLNNYVPIIIHPLFYTGIALIFAGLLLAVVRFMMAFAAAGGTNDPTAAGIMLSGLIYLVALVCFGIAWISLGNEGPSFAFNEVFFWGGGHVLQALNVSLALIAWFLLGMAWLGYQLVSPRALRLSILVALIAVLPTVFFYLVEDVRTTFTHAKYLLAFPVAVFVFASFSALKKPESKVNWQDPAFLALFLSFALFMIGGFLGLFVDGNDTRTPSHYHASLGGVNLAFMGLFYALFLPMLGRTIAPCRAQRVQLWTYGVGQLLQCAGLFVAGGHGAARKTAGAEQSLDQFWIKFGMGLNGGGALIAIVGGIMFVWMVGKALSRPNGPTILNDSKT